MPFSEYEELQVAENKGTYLIYRERERRRGRGRKEGE